jgi:lysophospholipase L1-like esterase
MNRHGNHSVVARVAAWAATAIWLFVFTGLFFHHSREPVLFHRFSLPYALGLLVFLALTPLVFFAVRTLFSPSAVKGPDGAPRVISPLSKISLLCLPALVVFGILQVALPKRQGWEYLPHPFLQAVPRPNPAKGINSRGFRGGEPATPKPKGLFRVVLLGGSTSFDPDLRYEDTYGRQLELALGKALAPRPAEVQCAAVSAYNSEHSLIRYAADAIDLDADVVLVMDSVNDVYVNTFRPFRRDYGTTPGVGPQHLHQGFRDRTHLVDTIGFFTRYVLFSDFRRPDDFRADDVVPDPEPFVRNLRSIVVLGRSRGQRVVLCTLPHRFRLDGPEADRVLGEAALRNFFNGAPLPGFVWFSRNMVVFNDRVRALAAEEGVPVLDFQRDVPPTKELFIDEIHVSPQGARLEAELATRFLLENSLVR